MLCDLIDFFDFVTFLSFCNLTNLYCMGINRLLFTYHSTWITQERSTVVIRPSPGRRGSTKYGFRFIRIH